MRALASTGLVALTVVVAGCSEYSASQEAKERVREQAIDVAHELAAGVFIYGPDGVESGLDRAFSRDRAEVVVHDDRAVVSISLISTVSVEGGGFNPDVKESAVLCVEYTVELAGGDTVIRGLDCPGELAAGEHIVEASIGDDIEIDSHDAMRALNRFQAAGSNARIMDYSKTAAAKELLPDAIAALEPLSHQDVVTRRDLNDALAEIALVPQSDETSEGIRFGTTVGGGCIYGTVGPGVLDVKAGGHPADGGPCIGGEYR